MFYEAMLGYFQQPHQANFLYFPSIKHKIQVMYVIAVLFFNKIILNLIILTKVIFYKVFYNFKIHDKIINFLSI
jgi:hypothetical protein